MARKRDVIVVTCYWVVSFLVGGYCYPPLYSDLDHCLLVTQNGNVLLENGIANACSEDNTCNSGVQFMQHAPACSLILSKVTEVYSKEPLVDSISVEDIKSVLDTPSCVGLRLYLIPSVEQGGNDEIYLFGFNASNEVLKDAANPQHQCYACRGGLQDAVTVGIAEGVAKVVPHTNLLRPSTSQSEYFKASFGRSRLE